MKKAKTRVWLCFLLCMVVVGATVSASHAKAETFQEQTQGYNENTETDVEQAIGEEEVPMAAAPVVNMQLFVCMAIGMVLVLSVITGWSSLVKVKKQHK